MGFLGVSVCRYIYSKAITCCAFHVLLIYKDESFVSRQTHRVLTYGRRVIKYFCFNFFVFTIKAVNEKDRAHNNYA